MTEETKKERVVRTGEEKLEMRVRRVFRSLEILAGTRERFPQDLIARVEGAIHDEVRRRCGQLKTEGPGLFSLEELSRRPAAPSITMDD